MLEQTGEYRIQAPREIVWQALNDPDALGKCIAGCQEISRVDDEHFDVTVKAKVGPVSATFHAALELTDLKPPDSYVIQGAVKGGAAGFAKGSADVELIDDAGATLLRYTLNASVGGKLAQIGSRLVDGAARKMASDFFAAFAMLLSETSASSASSASSSVESDASASSTDIATDHANDRGDVSAATGGSKSHLAQWPIWVIAFAALGLALVLSF